MRFAPIWLALASLVISPGCDTEEEKAAAEARKKAGEEMRRKANLSIEEHEVNCEKDDPVSCAAVATAYQIGEDKPSDPAKAQELFEKACNLKHAQSCLDAADKHIDDKAWAKAEALLDVGCKADDDAACTRLATVKQEIEKAKAPAEGGEAEGEAGSGAKAEGEMSEAERLMKEIEDADEDDNE